MEKSEFLFQLYELSNYSFDIEKKRIYNNFPTLQISNVNDLTAGTCEKIFNTIAERGDSVNNLDELLEILRDKQFYEVLRSIGKKDNSGKFTTTQLKEDIFGGFEDFLINQDVNEDSVSITMDMIKEFLNKGVTKESNNNKETFINIIADIQSNQVILTVKPNKKSGKIWTQDKVLRLVKNLQKFIKDSTGKQIEFQKKTTYTFNITEKATVEEIIPDFKNFLLYGIKVFSNEYGKNYKKLKTVLEELFDNNQSLFRNALENNKQGEELLTSKKSYYKVPGDLGEFLVGVFLNNIPQNEKGEAQGVKFAGSTRTKGKEAAVDLYLSNIGFQVKNYPAQEGSKIIQLYANREDLKKQDDSRAMSSDDKKDLFKASFCYNGGNSDTSIIKNIQQILMEVFPKFIRYEQRETDFMGVDDNEILKTLQNIKNNIYIVNFRIIPASRIFYEIALQYSAIITDQPKRTLDNYFYETIKKTKKTSSSQQNIFDSIKRIDRKYFTNDEPLYLVFRGLPINYEGLKLQGTNQNLLANSFKLVKLY